MRLATHRPGGALGELVDVLWLLEADSDPRARERALPTGTVELVVTLRAPQPQALGRVPPGDGVPSDAAVVCGAHSEPFLMSSGGGEVVAGVHFRPGGAFPFMRGPAGEVRNQTVALEDLWGRAAARELRDRLLAAGSPQALFALLERSLLARAVRPAVRHPAVAYALAAFERDAGGASVGAVTARTGYSHRRFLELFRDQVGLTPKAYCRVARFQRLLHAVGHSSEPDWAALAQACGYYDQAHLINEFQRLAGMSPGRYLRARTERLNHALCDS